jgi:hypothetical protein
MPVTILDPGIALVVVDLQKGLADYPTIHPCLDGAPLASSGCSRFAAPLGCGHAFDLLMRPFHEPLAMMPFPQILRSRPIARA